MMKKKPNPKGSVPAPVQSEEIDWEVRPGGMLVQRREDDDDDASGASVSSRGPMIRIDVAHGPVHHEVFVPAHSTFGDIKKHLSQRTGLEPNEQILLFRGKEKEDEEHLHLAGVKDNSKVLLLEDLESKERKVEETKESNEIPSNAGEDGAKTNEMLSNAGEVGVKTNEMSKASQAVAGIRDEVDKLSERVAALEVAVDGGTKVDEKEFAVSTELLMRQLLKLDSIEAEGEAKMQRKAEVRRVQNFVDTLDTLKARNSNPIPSNNSSNAVSVTTQWETFDSGVGCLSAPTPMTSSTEATQDWEKFD